MFRRAIEEGLIDPARMIQAGMRGPLYGEDDEAIPGELGVETIPWIELAALGPEAFAERVRARVGDGPTFLTLRRRLRRPRVLPGHRHAGGRRPDELRGPRVPARLAGVPFVGFDVVEVAPQYDGPGQVTALLRRQRDLRDALDGRGPQARPHGCVRRHVTASAATTHARLDWFTTREVVDGVWLLAEPGHVCTWLVAGTDRAVLLDTGMGFLPIRPLAESLTTRPVSVVNTHYHFDHVGGNHEFDDIVIHEIGAPLIDEQLPRRRLEAYLDFCSRRLEVLDRFVELDAEYFGVLNADSIPRPFPPDFDPAAWTIPASRATATLADGDRIDLGGRVLTVLHTPGHSPDGICLLEEREGLLFAADTINAGAIYAQFDDSDLDALVTSTRRLADLADGIRLITTHHCEHVIAEVGFLEEIADGLVNVQAGEPELVPARDITGTPVLEACFPHFSVALPWPTEGAYGS